MVPMIAGSALVSKEEEQAEEKNGRKGEATEVIRTFSQLCICSRRILSSCSNSLYRVGFADCKVATSRSFGGKVAS